MSSLIVNDKLPTSIQIETTNRCILKCPVCATPWIKSRQKGDFPYQQFKTLFKDVDWKIDSCDFGWSGEPFLNHDLFKMISECAQKSIYSHVATNGMFLGSYSSEIVSCGLNSINISLDGVNQQMLEIYRVGADFDKIIKGIELLVSEKERSQSGGPYITLQMIVMKHTEDFVDKFVELARTLGVDSVLLKSFNIEEGFWLSQSDKQKMADKFIPQNNKFKRVNQSQDGYLISDQISSAKCLEVNTTPVILWDGNVSMCCVDFEAKTTFGNINTTSLKNVWLSDYYREYRQKAHLRYLNICSRCMYPGSDAFNYRIDVV